MKCSACDHDNRDEAKFCSNCGGALEKNCIQCGHALAPGAKFCDNCGTKTDSEGAVTPEPLPEKQAPAEKLESLNLVSEAERRQLTVMFCDLVGSTQISELLDPEDLRHLLAEYQNCCKAVINNLGGHIARYIGDGLLVYFGYPVSYEDSAHRAVRAGCEIIESVKSIPTETFSSKIKMAVRIGINTGSVVVGDIGSGENHEHMAVIGDVPNLAARLQAIAEPDNVVIGNQTFQLVKNLFEFENLGPQSLKGISEKINAYRVIGELTNTNRFESVEKQTLGSIVGREAEINLLVERWKKTKEGDGQVLLLSGEAGIGKSRILKKFCDQLKSEEHDKHVYICSSQHTSSAFFPLITQINKNIGIELGDSNKTKLSKLGIGLQKERSAIDNLALWYAFLLGLVSEDDDAFSSLTPQQCKQRTFLAVIEHFQALSKARPLLMIVEDLHWIDPSSLDIFMLWANQLQDSRCLLIFTFRPEFEQQWPHYSHFTSLELNRLSRKESAKIVSEISGGKQLPNAVFDQIIKKTDGVPLFVEELTKVVLESELLESKGDEYILKGTLPELAIPESLQDSLMARLDRLGKVKEIAQLAATIGRRFTYELLTAVSGLKSDELDVAINQLLDVELIYKRGVIPEIIYEFKHALVQETAYQTLLKSTRQQYHYRIAQVLENDFPDTVENQPEQLAHHYTEAGAHEKAVELWYQAGQKAASQSANLEAIDQLKKGLQCLMSLPDTDERAKLELRMQITLAVPLTAAKGYASEEVEKTYLRARELCQKIDDVDQLFQTLYGMWRFYLLHAEYQQAKEVSKNIMDIADRENQLYFVMSAQRSRGATLFYVGEFDQSHESLKKVIALESSPEQKTKSSMLDVVDVVVVSHAYNSWLLWLKGYPDKAREESEIAIQVAESCKHPFSVNLALCFACLTHQFCGDKQRTQEIANTALKLSFEYSFEFWVGWAEILKSWADHSGASSAIESMEQGLNDWLKTGSRLGQTYFMVLLAEAANHAGQTDKSITILNEAHDFAFNTGESFWKAEINRQQGEIILSAKLNSQIGAESYFAHALETAKQQNSLALELRAAISLHRLNQTQSGKSPETYRSIEAIYNRYTEGFDTTDLCTAKAILENDG